MQPDDGLIIVMSHKGSFASFQTGMKKIPNYMAKYFSDYNFILIYPIHTIAEESENRDLLNASLLPNFNKFQKRIGKSISKALKAKMTAATAAVRTNEHSRKRIQRKPERNSHIAADLVPVHCPVCLGHHRFVSLEKLRKERTDSGN